MSRSEVEKVFDYLDNKIHLADLEAYLLDLAASDESALSRRLVGLLAEASHAHWGERGIREELASAIFPFLESETRVGTPPARSLMQYEINKAA